MRETVEERFFDRRANALCFLGHDQGFRQAPSFEARAEAVKDDALLERLLAIYAKKYPDEIDKWRDRMRRGYTDGTRVLIRYTP